MALFQQDSSFLELPRQTRRAYRVLNGTLAITDKGIDKIELSYSVVGVSFLWSAFSSVHKNNAFLELNICL